MRMPSKSPLNLTSALISVFFWMCVFSREYWDPDSNVLQPPPIVHNTNANAVNIFMSVLYNISHNRFRYQSYFRQWGGFHLQTYFAALPEDGWSLLCLFDKNKVTKHFVKLKRIILYKSLFIIPEVWRFTKLKIIDRVLLKNTTFYYIQKSYRGEDVNRK